MTFLTKISLPLPTMYLITVCFFAPVNSNHCDGPVKYVSVQGTLIHSIHLPMHTYNAKIAGRAGAAGGTPGL